MSDPHRRWISLALVMANRSIDPRTRVGAIIVTEGRRQIGEGWNRLPYGLRPRLAGERLACKETKLRLIVHAEMAALIDAMEEAGSVTGCTIYIAATDDTGAVWGGCCTRCTVHLLEAGITRFVSPPPKAGSSWAADLAEARALIAEAGAELIEVPFPAKVTA